MRDYSGYTRGIIMETNFDDFVGDPKWRNSDGDPLLGPPQTVEISGAGHTGIEYRPEHEKVLFDWIQNLVRDVNVSGIEDGSLIIQVIHGMQKTVGSDSPVQTFQPSGDFTALIHFRWEGKNDGK